MPKKPKTVYIVMQRCMSHVGCGSVPVSVHHSLDKAHERIELERKYTDPQRFTFGYTTATLER